MNLSKRKLEERTNNLIINAEDILDLRVFVKDYGRKQHKMYKYEFMYSMWGM